MFNEVKKEVIGNIEGLANKTQRFSVRFLSIIVSYWLIIGTIVIGLVVPVYVVKSLIKVRWAGEAQASVGIVNSIPKQTVQPKTAETKDRYSSQANRYGGASSFRKGLNETTDTMNEFRHLVRGIASFRGR